MDGFLPSASALAQSHVCLREIPLPQWMADELDLREREDADTEEDADVVMARLLAKHSARRQSPPSGRGS